MNDKIITLRHSVGDPDVEQPHHVLTARITDGGLITYQAVTREDGILIDTIMIMPSELDKWADVVDLALANRAQKFDWHRGERPTYTPPF